MRGQGRGKPVRAGRPARERGGSSAGGTVGSAFVKWTCSDHTPVRMSALLLRKRHTVMVSPFGCRCRLAVAAMCLCTSPATPAAAFVHPCVLHLQLLL